jgi:hypothetical protein
VNQQQDNFIHCSSLTVTNTTNLQVVLHFQKLLDIWEIARWQTLMTTEGKETSLDLSEDNLKGLMNRDETMETTGEATDQVDQETIDTHQETHSQDPEKGMLLPPGETFLLLQRGREQETTKTEVTETMIEGIGNLPEKVAQG